MLNGLDLFSGIGGIALALRDYVRPIAYCEIEPYCQGVLLSRMSTGGLRTAPIWDDICTFDGSRFKQRVDIIYGGFPCQDISIAGTGKGLEGERSGLFFEMLRLAKEIQPKFLFIENVPAITTRGGITVSHQIAEMGYDCRWCIISAASIGALHKRDRWFLLAQSNSESIRQQQESKKSEETSKFTSDGKTQQMAHSLRTGLQERQEKRQNKIKEIPTIGDYGDYHTVELWQEAVSEMDKCTDGIPFDTHRLRALGNSVVPTQAKEAFKILMGLN